MKKTLITTVISVFLSATAVSAQTSAMESYRATEVRNNVTKLEVGSGRVTLIDLPENERIIHIVIGDRSRFTYALDSELGEAKGVILRKIEELDFPGATEAYVTNLLVTTLDNRGESHRYFFDLVPVSGVPTTNGVRIAQPQTNGVVNVSSYPPRPGDSNATWVTSLGRATAIDIRRGLRLAISRGYTAPDDPIVAKVRNWIASVENGISVIEALEREDFSAGVLTNLGEMGLAAIRQPLSPVSPGFVDFTAIEGELEQLEEEDDETLE
ncbi:UNVERIFIED_CONTAM: hypothetical protein BEN50_10975 [Euhalothece sp. KZN 001]